MIARRLGGSNIVLAIDGGLILKIYPPRMRAQWEAERRVLPLVDGKLSVATPTLVKEGELDDHTFVIMTSVPGRSLEEVWDSLDEPSRIDLLAQIGALMREVQAIDPFPLTEIATPWPEFLDAQRAACAARHPGWDIEPFLDRVELPRGPIVLLTGEYTPMNLLVDDRARIVSMIDFGDARVGAPEYDLLGPLTFLCAGDRARVAALFDARGLSPSPDTLLALLLLHRHSDLDAQIRIPSWRDRAHTLEALAALLCPL